MFDDEIRSALDLEIAEDALQVQVRPILPLPPRGLNATVLHRYLKSCGILHGVERELLKSFISEWKAGEPGPWIAANGTPAVAGNSGGLERLSPPARTGSDDVELLPLYVKQGDPLFQLIEETAGQGGVDVLGHPVAPPPSEAPPLLTAGKGISVEDGVWTARATGFLHADESELKIVKTMLHSHCIGPGTYRWSSDAKISGSVAPETTIEVSGHLIIEGDVGLGVQLRAEGDIRVEGEIAGGGSTTIEAEGRVKVQYAEGTMITAGDDVVVIRGLTDCQCRVRGTLQAATEGCVIRGGTVEAIGGAEIADAVASGLHPASIEVGHASWINEQMHEIECEIRRWILYHGKLFEDFKAKHGTEGEDRSKVWNLAEEKRIAFYEDEDAVHAEQQRVDLRVSRLRSRLESLIGSRTSNARAVVLIHGSAEASTRISIRGRRYDTAKKTLQGVAVGIFGETKSICAIPTVLYQSSEMC